MESLLILYDKRDSCPFLKVKIFHIEINIPNNIFYSTFAGEKLRIVRSNLHFLIFSQRISEMISRKPYQEWNIWKVYWFLQKNINKNQENFSKFFYETHHLMTQKPCNHLYQLKLRIWFFLLQQGGGGRSTSTHTYNQSHHNRILNTKKVSMC